MNNCFLNRHMWIGKHILLLLMKKHIKYILSFIALIFISFNINAQDDISLGINSGTSDKGKSTFLRWVDKIIIGKKNYDTLYYDSPYGKWSVSLFENFSQHHYYLITDGYADPIRNRLGTSTGIGVSYKGLGIGISFNFKKISGKTKDSEFGLRLYSNKFGGDIRFFNVGDFYDIRFKSDVSYNNRLKGFNINTYYVLNNKKFSYSAPFSFSKIQKISAGSVIIVMSFYHDKLNFGYDKDLYAEILNDIYQGWDEFPVSDTISKVLSGWKTNYLSLGAGYAYNWVPAKSWLIHVSLEPSLLIWHRRVVSLDDVYYSSPNPETSFDVTINNNEMLTPYFFFNFGCNGKASISYSAKRWFVAAYYVGNMNFIHLRGMDEILYGKSHSIYRYWNARLTVGYRF